MDLSKLPRMGESTQHSTSPPGAEPREHPQPAAAPEPEPRRALPIDDGPPERPAMGPESFITVVVGLLVIYMGWAFFDYLIHLATGRPFNYPVTDATGAPMRYTSSIFFWLNMGAALFGVALVGYGLFGRTLNLALSWGVLLLLAAAAAVNVTAVIVSMTVAGLQILPALCAAFGIYLGLYQWARVKALSSASAA